MISYRKRKRLPTFLEFFFSGASSGDRSYYRHSASTIDNGLEQPEVGRPCYIIFNNSKKRCNVLLKIIGVEPMIVVATVTTVIIIHELGTLLSLAWAIESGMSMFVKVCNHVIGQVRWVANLEDSFLPNWVMVGQLQWSLHLFLWIKDESRTAIFKYLPYCMSDEEKSVDN